MIHDIGYTPTVLIRGDRLGHYLTATAIDSITHDGDDSINTLRTETSADYRVTEQSHSAGAPLPPNPRVHAPCVFRFASPPPSSRLPAAECASRGCRVKFAPSRFEFAAVLRAYVGSNGRCESVGL